MASKTIDHMDFYVDVKPYTTKDNGDQVFDVLNVSVSYRKGRGFRADYHPGWKTGWGGFGCIIDFSSNPLTSTTYVDIDPTATKNNVKRLEQYKANLELAAKGIAAYFDARNFAGLNTFIEGVALYGYTQHHKDSADFVAMKNAENNSNNQTSEDKTMKTNETKNENENVAMEAQVNNVKTDVDIAEVDDIVPVVTKKKVAEAMVQAANGGPATTLPLGKHGTLVIAGVGGTKKEEPKADSQKPEAKVQDSVPQGKLQYVTYEVKKVNKTTKKEYTVTGSKIVGFELTDPIYLAGPSFNGAIHTEQQDGKTVGVLRFSHKWTPAVKEVCDKLNAGGTVEDCVAIITGAKDARWQRIQERKQKREERKAAREAKKAENTNTNRTNDTNQPTAGYSAQDVAAMLQKVLAGGELPKDVEALMKKAA